MSNTESIDFTRVKIVRIPIRVAVNFLFAQRQVPQYVSLPSVTLPEGCKIISRRENPFSNSIDVLVWHPSFDPVPEEGIPPQFMPDVEWKSYALATEAEVSSRTYSDNPVIAIGIRTEEPR